MGRVYDYDVLVIGAGIAGLSASVTAATLGKKVAIIEGGVFGGSCTSFSCLPSKALIRASQIVSDVRQVNTFGISLRGFEQVDLTHLLDIVRIKIYEMQKKDAPVTLATLGIIPLMGKAEFTSANTVGVGLNSFSAGKIIIATGTQPRPLTIPGLKETPHVNTETFYDLKQIPRSVLIIGAGVSGLEFASALCSLGSSVTLIEANSTLIPATDRELANLLANRLNTLGVTILQGVKLISLKSAGDHVLLSIQRVSEIQEVLEAEVLVLAAGRQSNIGSLALEKAGVIADQRGIAVNDFLQTSISNIYACGDVTGKSQSASTAETQGIIAGLNASLPLKRHFGWGNQISVIFTNPPLAETGLTETDARRILGQISVYRIDYSTMRRALIDGDAFGLAKIICGSDGKVAGAHILGEAAAEIIHELELIRQMGIPLHKVHGIPHAYPTYSQAIIGRASQLAYIERMRKSFFFRSFLNLLGYRSRLGAAFERLAESQGMPVCPIEKDPVEYKIGFEAGTCTVELPDRVTDTRENELVSACLSRRDFKTLRFDFGHVKLMNCLGLTMLLKAANLAHAAGLGVFASNLLPHHDKVLAAAGFGALACTKPVIQTAQHALDVPFWAAQPKRLDASGIMPPATKLNLHGKRAQGPPLGFGTMWQKRYQLVIEGNVLSPARIIETLKHNFIEFQPSYNHFYTTERGIEPGEVVAIQASTPGGPLSTGVMVLYSDATSFCFITAQGHPEAGIVSFHSFKYLDKTVIEIFSLSRASDPIYEAAFRIFGSSLQTRIWKHFLGALAAHLGVPANLIFDSKLIDSRLQPQHTVNILHNAQVRTTLHLPWRVIRRLTERRPG